METNVITFLGFVLLFGLMIARVPIGISMGIIGVGGFAAFSGIDPALSLVTHSPITTLTNFTMGLIPLFILMGTIGSASGISRELYRAGQAWLGPFKGGLAMATIVACGGFAAVCGSSVATAATMTQLALPEMRRLGYSDVISTGAIAAGGTMGVLIPPSIGLAVYGLLVQQDVGRLFIAGIVPGIVTILMYLLGIIVWVWFQPNIVPKGEPTSWAEKWRSLRGIWAVLVLFMFVIGGIYGGLFTPTEAGGIGASGSLLIALIRRRISLMQLKECLIASVRTSAAVMVIIAGAVIFGYFLTITRTPQMAAEFLIGLDLGRYGTLSAILIILIFLGCFIDTMAVIILIIPIVYPIIKNLGFDPIWFGLIVVVTIEIGMISPPVGLNVFVIKSMVRDVSLSTIYRGIAPFLIVDFARLILFIVFPQLVIFLPNLMKGF